MPYWRATEAKVEGSSQRIQEDCMNFAKIVESIGLQVVKAIMTLIAFIPILWALSSNVTVPYLDNPIAEFIVEDTVPTFVKHGDQ